MADLEVISNGTRVYAIPEWAAQLLLALAPENVRRIPKRIAHVGEGAQEAIRQRVKEGFFVGTHPTNGDHFIESRSAREVICASAASFRTLHHSFSRKIPRGPVTLQVRGGIQC
jgi:hypothetical protein